VKNLVINYGGMFNFKGVIMKKISKALSILLVFTLLLIAVACSDDDDSTVSVITIGDTSTDTSTDTSADTQSGDAGLASLTLSSGSLNETFASGTTSYTADLGVSVQSLQVIPTASNGGASISVNGSTVTSGSASGDLVQNLGGNTVTILVTAEDEVTTQTYTLTATWALKAQQAYIKASNTAATDQFTRSIALSGDTLVIGAPQEDSSATGINGDQGDNTAAEAGAAYVFVRSGDTWSQQAYLKASNAEGGDYFGYGVAISGDTIVVGAHKEDSSTTTINGTQNDEGAVEAGAAYIFVRSGAVWSQQAYLKASDAQAGDYFGRSVAIDNSTIVVGAESEDGVSSGEGAAYIFVRSGTTWSEQAKVKGLNTGINDGFGQHVAISGETIVVAAVNEASNATGVDGDGSDNSQNGAGAAYVFVRSGTSWTQEAYLKASNTKAGDVFGTSISISGDTIAVGAPEEDSNATGVNGDDSNDLLGYSGAVYVYVRSGAIWSQQAYIKASNPGIDYFFGSGVALSGDILIVGSGGEPSNATGLNGDQTDTSMASAGAAYLFSRPGTTWTQHAYLKASNTTGNDLFGDYMAVDGDTVVVGAWNEGSDATGVTNGPGSAGTDSLTYAGAAYIYK
jgi:FG-GAP repeat protein/cadherin-like protein